MASNMGADVVAVVCVAAGVVSGLFLFLKTVLVIVKTAYDIQEIRRRERSGGSLSIPTPEEVARYGRSAKRREGDRRFR